MKFFNKHKRVILIIAIALIIIGTAYYFTLGKEKRDTDPTSSDSSSSSGSNSLLPSSTVTSNSTFPLKWGVFNTNTVLLQKRLNLSVTTCNTGTKISEDGVLGAQTVSAIKRSFPNIGLSVEANRYVAQSQFTTIVNSQPQCV